MTVAVAVAGATESLMIMDPSFFGCCQRPDTEGPHLLTLGWQFDEKKPHLGGKLYKSEFQWMGGDTT